MFPYVDRATVRERLGKLDKAIRDYRRVAQCKSKYRDFTVIQIEYLFSRKHDYKNVIKTLDGYEYIINDPDISKKYRAVAYYNRCFANMKLGELQRALAACTESLRYGNVYDAQKIKDKIARQLQSVKSI